MDASVFVFQKDFFMSQLQGLLNDICNVYLHICMNGRQIMNDENTIRDEFGVYFENQTYKDTTTTAKDFFFESEGRRQKTAGRVDIRFLSPNCYGHQDAYFAIECKRLDGNSHLSREYVDNGIKRYTTGKYPSLLGCNAMLGFVVCTIDLTATVSQINNHLAIGEHLRIVSKTMDTMIDLESHHSAPHDFVLYHLWLDFSGLVVK